MATYLRIGAVGAGSTDIRIEGDVTASGHSGWIELASFSFGSTPASDDDDDDDDDGDEASGGASVADTGKSGSQRFRETGFTLSKWAGADSPKIVDWALSGKPYDLQIDCCREGGEAFMRVFLTKARVQSFGQKAGEKDVEEEIKLLFESIAFESTGFDKEGKRRTPTRAATQSAGATVAVRTGPAALVGGRGKGVGQRAAKTSAQETAERVAAGMRQGGEVPEFVQEDRILSIDAINGVEFELGGFVGSEEMSGLFHFRLEVTSSDLQVAAADVIGQSVSFRIEDHEDIDADRTSPVREFHGIVAELHAGQKAVDHRDYTLVVVPELWLLTKRSDCRIFQQKTVVEIVEAVFSNAGFTAFDKSNVRGSYPALEYCVQYRETDFAFVSRLLEEHGIFYFFRFASGSHKMILADSAVAHANCEHKDVVQSTGSVDGKHVREWVKRLRHVSGRVRYRDYNHSTPAQTLESEATSVVDIPNIDKYELYDYPGRYATVSEGGDRAKAHMEAEEVGHCVVDATGNCDAFACGTKFTIDSHECDEEVGQEYVLTGVVHQAYLLPMSDVKPRLYYENEIECIPKATTFRPARSTPRPVVRGPQTAAVVGVQGEEIDPDKYGSVKVQFHWDREGQKDENSSCFVRVAQGIAGRNWGSVWLPRIGQEVVVEFLEGDPDRPLITGSVYNEDNLPPYTLPANKTQSVWKTRSSKSGAAENFNELRFEDKKGSEHVYFHAEKDFERVVENDDALTVGKDGAGSQTVTVEKDRTVTVNEGDETYVVKQGNRSVTVETGDDTHTVKQGNRTATVETGNETLAVKQGNRDVSIDMGNDTLTVKMGNRTTKVNLGKYTAEAMQGIELKVGANSITIDQTGITLSGTLVKVEGQVSTEISGLICQIDGSAMLEAGGGITMLG